MKAIDRNVSERIAILRTLLIFGIVLLHVPPALTAADLGSDWFDHLKFALSRGMFRATVPALTAISGFLLFVAAARFDYRKVVAGKAKRIAFPFLLWNLPLVALLYAIESQGMMAHHFRVSLVPFDALTFANAALALTDQPVNYPLDFLRDLFVLFLLSPVFLWLIRHAKWAGLLAVGVVFLKDWDGLLILRSTMPISFYLGGMLAVHRHDLTALDQLWPAALIALLSASAAIGILGIENVEWFRIISPPLVWIAAAPLVGTAIGRPLKRWASASFFVFLSHGPLLLATYVLYQGLGEPIPYPLYWLAAPIAVCAVSLTAERMLRRHLPAFAAFLVGDFKAMRGQPPRPAPGAADPRAI